MVMEKFTTKFEPRRPNKIFLTKTELYKKHIFIRNSTTYVSQMTRRVDQLKYNLQHATFCPVIWSEKAKRTQKNLTCYMWERFIFGVMWSPHWWRLVGRYLDGRFVDIRTLRDWSVTKCVNACTYRLTTTQSDVDCKDESYRMNEWALE